MPEVSVPAPPPLVRIPHVELIHTGTWPISNGVWTATREDLQAAVAALDCPAIHRAGIKIGHVDDRFTDPSQDGEPLLGYIDNLAGEDDWNTLVGDYAGVPAWLGGTDADGNSVISSAYPQRSIEGIHDFQCQIGHTHPFVLTAVALLGATHPGVGTLQSLPDLMALYGVAAATGPANGTPVRAAVHDIPLTATTQANAGPGERSTMPNPSPTKVAAGVTTEDVRRQYYDDAPGWDYWITEFHLDPLQLIVCDDRSGKHYRVPVNLTGEDTFTFGEPAEVLVRYVDAQSDATVAASAGDKRLVYASRAESRPGQRPAAADEPVEVQPVQPEGEPVDVVEPTPEAPDEAPADVPAAEPDAPTIQEDDMSLSAIRARLGLGDDADEAAVLAALDAKLPTGPADSTAPDKPAAVPAPEPVAAAKPTLPEGVVAIDATTLAELRRGAELGIKAAERQRISDRDRVIEAAREDGRISSFRVEHWVKAWEADPDGTQEILASLEPGLVVPTVLAGSTGTGEETADLDGFGGDAMSAWASQLGIDAKELTHG